MLRVLVVEDNLDAQYLVCEMLKAFGHTVTGTGNAEDALASLAEHPFDILFTDVSLPGISGIDLARRARQARPELGIIFASGYGDTLAARVDFPCISLKKPYDLEQLQAALAKASSGNGVR
jgi:CheY-like chemotaxis protein